MPIDPVMSNATYTIHPIGRNEYTGKAHYRLTVQRGPCRQDWGAPDLLGLRRNIRELREQGIRRFRPESK